MRSQQQTVQEEGQCGGFYCGSGLFFETLRWPCAHPAQPSSTTSALSRARLQFCMRGSNPCAWHCGPFRTMLHHHGGARRAAASTYHANIDVVVREGMPRLIQTALSGFSIEKVSKFSSLRPWLVNSTNLPQKTRPTWTVTISVLVRVKSCVIADHPNQWGTFEQILRDRDFENGVLKFPLGGLIRISSHVHQARPALERGDAEMRDLAALRTDGSCN